MVFVLRQIHKKCREQNMSLYAAFVDLTKAFDILLAHIQGTLQYIVDRFAEAAQAFDLTINLKKTEVMYPSPPREVYSPPRISIDDTVEQLTYLGSIISNDATVSKDLDNKLALASSSCGCLSK
ncbi:hypothetical protein ACOMHN_026084 [Nucella lapillus]